VSARALQALISFLLLLASPFANAGGDYVSGHVTSFHGGDNDFTFVFVASSPERGLMEQCTTIEVQVEYSRVPWFSWLPFIRSGHPTKQQTMEAGRYLSAAHGSHNLIRFGYIGYGLLPTETMCSFRSRGLRLEYAYADDQAVVLSYHDQT